MFLGEEFRVFGNWFLIHFTENNGMAFGLEFGGNFGKLFLSVFRIVAVIAIGWYLFYLVRTRAHKGLIASFALIFAGAIGNILDSAFYGMIFSTSTYTNMAQIFPPGGGYARFLHGQVVDMLYFPMVHGHFPSWFPFWGGEDFLFFRPVFNIADSSITIGVAILFMWQKKFYAVNKNQEALSDPAVSEQA
jgi:signal peptidase II